MSHFQDMQQPLDDTSFVWSKRGLMVVMASAACGVGFLDRSAAGLLVVPMSEELGWTLDERGHVLSAFFSGYICTQIFGGLLAQRLGPRLVLGTAILLWSLATMIIPEAAVKSPQALFMALCTMGMMQGPIMPSMTALLSRWIPPTERARAISLTGVGVASGSLSAYYFAPLLAVVLGWRNVWRIFGCIGIIFAAVWFSLVRDDPSSSSSRLQGILAEPEADDKSQAFANRAEGKSMFAALRNPQLRSWPAAAVYVAHMGQTSGNYTLLLWVPTYFSRVFNLPIGELGIYLTAPKFVEIAVALYIGQVADGLLKRGYTIVQVRQLCICTSFCVSAMTFVVFAHAQQLALAACCVCILQACVPVCSAGFNASYLDIGGQDSGVMQSCGNMLASLPGIATPIFGAWVVARTGSWHGLFQTIAVLQMFAAAFFYVNIDRTPSSNRFKV